MRLTDIRPETFNGKRRGAALGLQNIPLFALCCAGTVAAFAVGYFIIYHLTARTYYKIVR